ncbi:50S ribosomal protein L31 [Candidatus Dependentiae bacterium]
MKKDIHPKLNDVTVSCTCGATFQMRSTLPSIKTTLCSKCHPFYTGEQRFVDTMGRIERFEQKYKKHKKKGKKS